MVEQTANRFKVDPELVHAIIRVESGYDPQAISSKGAMGLMQLIPATAQRFGVANPFDPKQNIEGGVNYLKYLLNLFGGNLPLSLAAYNAGEHTVQRSGGIPAIPETQNYVRKITGIYQPGDVSDCRQGPRPRSRPGLPSPAPWMSSGWCILPMLTSENRGAGQTSTKCSVGGASASESMRGTGRQPGSIRVPPA